jgi:hypothetical protein
MKNKKNKNPLRHGVAETFEQLQLRLELNFIREAVEVIVRELAAIQQVKDCLNALLRLCWLHSELIVSEIGEWLLDNFVQVLNALMVLLTSMADMAVDTISQAKLALLSGTALEEREKALNAIHELTESSMERSIILQQIIRLASDSLVRFRQALA